MSHLFRWFKFNLVGVLGMAVQLSALGLLNRCLPGRYFVTTALALELTLLHNFAWHIRFTWRDRRDQSPRLMQLVRFHLSNGLFSALGNLSLVWLLVRRAHLPLLLSNFTAILCCSLVNFYLGDAWIFASSPTP